MYEKIREEIAEMLMDIEVDLKSKRGFSEAYKAKADQILSIKADSLTLKELIELYEQGKLLEKADNQDSPVSALTILMAVGVFIEKS